MEVDDLRGSSTKVWQPGLFTFLPQKNEIALIFLPLGRRARHRLDWFSSNFFFKPRFARARSASPSLSEKMALEPVQSLTYATARGKKEAQF